MRVQSYANYFELQTFSFFLYSNIGNNREET